MPQVTRSTAVKSTHCSLSCIKKKIVAVCKASSKEKRSLSSLKMRSARSSRPRRKSCTTLSAFKGKLGMRSKQISVSKSQASRGIAPQEKSRTT
eukprot:g22816.t1